MRFGLLYILIIFNFTASSQWHCRVYFTDKDTQRFDAADLFDQSSLDRRAMLGIELEASDYPLSSNYVKAILNFGQPIHQSRWFNMQSIHCTENTEDALNKLYFVKEAHCYLMRQNNQAHLISTYTEQSEDDLFDETKIAMQSDQLEADIFRERSLNGTGIRIAVLDVGFKGADISETLAHLNVIADHDFISKHSKIYRYHDHGTRVLSCIGGEHDGIFLGLAPAAEFLLARTEHTGEYLVEEESWVEAAEWADQMGARIIHSSLGYTWQRYWTYQMNGETSLVSKAAAIASSKGIFVVASAGNEGESEWRTVSAPADSDSVLSVGAIDRESGIHAPYSSFGPTSDYRLKPNVSALGNCYVAGEYELEISEGTSYAAPLVTGFAACLLQNQPDLSPYALRKSIEQSGHLFPYFDYAHGYGTPLASKALGLTNGNCNPELIRFASSDNATGIICKMVEKDSGQFNPEVAENFLYYHIEDPDGKLLLYRLIMPHRATYQNGKVRYEALEEDAWRKDSAYNPLRIAYDDYPKPFIIRAWFQGAFIEKIIE